MYHYRRKRIEAYICIAFVAYTIYKELERLLEQARAELSPKRAAELTHTMYGLDHQPTDGSNAEKIILKMDPDQQLLYNIVQKG